MPPLRHWQVTESRTLPFLPGSTYAPLRHWQIKNPFLVLHSPGRKLGARGYMAFQGLATRVFPRLKAQSFREP